MVQFGTFIKSCLYDDGKEPQFIDLFKLMKWTLSACGLHFRILYEDGATTWLSRASATMAVESGYKMLAPLCRN